MKYFAGPVSLSACGHLPDEAPRFSPTDDVSQNSTASGPPIRYLMLSFLIERGDIVSGSVINLASRIEQDHNELRTWIDQIGVLFDSRPDEGDFLSWKIDVLWQLRDFQNQLQKHFDLEEDGGYNTDLIQIAPRLSTQVAHLEEDHRKIISDLNHILDNMKRINEVQSPMILRIKDRVDALLFFIKDHESKENAIIQEAYYQDFGIGD